MHYIVLKEPKTLKSSKYVEYNKSALSILDRENKSCYNSTFLFLHVVATTCKCFSNNAIGMEIILEYILERNYFSNS